MLASDIVNRAARTIFDLTNVRWPVAELLDYVNDGQRAVVFFRPDANAKNTAMQMVGGTKQTLPADGIRFLRAMRNMGNTGTTPGRAVRECSRVSLDNEVPDWHYANPSTVVEHYVFDNIDPRHFYVFPCVTGSVGANAACYLEVVYSALPAVATTVNDTLTLADQYINPIYDWVLYRAYSKDAAYAGNLARAQAHLQAFGSALDINMKTEWMAAAARMATPTPAAAPAQAGN